jgi:hypothetical protein
MARIILVDGISDPTNGKGSVILAALNSMFADLYSASSVPTKAAGASTDQVIAIAADTLILSAFVNKVSGTPIIKIGTTNGGEEILAATTITGWQKILIDYYYSGAGNLYIALSGGVVDLRIDKLLNYMA